MVQHLNLSSQENREAYCELEASLVWHKSQDKKKKQSYVSQWQAQYNGGDQLFCQT